MDPAVVEECLCRFPRSTTDVCIPCRSGSRHHVTERSSRGSDDRLHWCHTDQDGVGHTTEDRQLDHDVSKADSLAVLSGLSNGSTSSEVHRSSIVRDHADLVVPAAAMNPLPIQLPLLDRVYVVRADRVLITHPGEELNLHLFRDRVIEEQLLDLLEIDGGQELLTGRVPESQILCDRGDQRCPSQL